MNKVYLQINHNAHTSGNNGYRVISFNRNPFCNLFYNQAGKKMICPHCLKKIVKKKATPMKRCLGCYYKIMPYNKTGYCYRCRRGKYNVNTGRWEGGMR